MSTGPEAAPIELLHDFRVPETAARWAALDDRVMGGITRSRLVASASGTALFCGSVSRANGGGFASVRSAPEPRDLRTMAGIALRFRGDGHDYQLRLRDDAGFDGLTYQAPLATAKGVWSLARLRFEEFRATFRGRVVPDAPPLDLGVVTTCGLLIGDGQVGAFELELAWIGAFRD